MGAAPSLKTIPDQKSPEEARPAKPVPTHLWLPHHNTEKWKTIQETLKTPVNNEKQLWVVICQVTAEDTTTKYWSKQTGKNFQTSLGNWLKTGNGKQHKTKFFRETLPKIFQLALRLPEYFPTDKDIPLLFRKQKGKIEIPRNKIACLLCNAFLCTFDTCTSSFPELNWIRLYYHLFTFEAPEIAKFNAFMNYLERVAHGDELKGNLDIIRIVLEEDPKFNESNKSLIDVDIQVKGGIENSVQKWQVDFANAYIGGGTIIGGCVQEEISFAEHPELLASCFFCEVMESREAIILIGAEKFSQMKGYKDSLRFSENHIDNTPERSDGSKDLTIVAIDAIDFRDYKSPRYQFRQKLIQRELVKAYAGFYDPNVKTEIATGNWGCGAFLGDKKLKFVIQYLAACEAERQLIYYTFGDSQFAKEIAQFVKLLQEQKYTVGTAWEILQKYEKGKREMEKMIANEGNDDDDVRIDIFQFFKLFHEYLDKVTP